jgi:hypothetical protein
MRGILLRSPAAGWAAETFELLLSGAHAIVFGSHRIALDAEDVGFEVRDCLACFGPQRHQIWLLRKPCSEATVAAQVLATGTGAIWIDGCRVAGPGNVTFQRQPGERDRGQYRTGTVAGPQVPTSLGRWPANAVWVHLPGCRNVGTRKVPGHQGYPNGPGGKSFQYSSDKRGVEVRPDAWAGHADADGLETIAAWECAPGCSVAALDRQSGPLKSGGYPPAGGMRTQVSTYGKPSQYKDPAFGSSEGTASRFFPQFKDDAELDCWLLRLILG